MFDVSPESEPTGCCKGYAMLTFPRFEHERAADARDPEDKENIAS